jgi:hypothetical protein
MLRLRSLSQRFRPSLLLLTKSQNARWQSGLHISFISLPVTLVVSRQS